MAVNRSAAQSADAQAAENWGTRAEQPQHQNHAAQVLGLRPTERLFIEKTLLNLYPRLQRYDLFPWNLLHGPLIPDFLVKNTSLRLRRIVIIGCGDGVLCNILSLLFPTIEIVGIDPSSAKIAAARATVGHRQNLKFVRGNAVNMLEIPCDRIIYDHCLGQLGDSTSLRKLLVKTLRWIVPEGDFIVREAPLSLLKYPGMLKEFWPHLRTHKKLEAGIQNILIEMGYPQLQIFACQRIRGLTSEIYYRTAKTPTSEPDANLASQETVTEWQDLGDQSTHSVLGFLFRQSSSDFSHELS